MLSSRHCLVDEVVFDGASDDFPLEHQPDVGTLVVELVLSSFDVKLGCFASLVG